MAKVFVIGANKTGTTSLTKALRTLGFNLCPEHLIFAPNSKYLVEPLKGNYECLFPLIEKYNAFEDRPWNHNDFYKVLDKKYEGSKFILTIRNTENWVNSYLRWDKKINLRGHWFYTLVSQSLYGNKDFLADLDNMKEKYETRNKEIIEYFKDRDNLLIMDLENMDGWDKLCSFLGCPIPKEKFPHENKTK